LWDFDALGMDPDYHELQFYRRDIKIKNPKLWYPNGFGEAHLYQVSVSLWQDGKQYDEATFPFGIRTFTAGETAGNKYRARWEKFLFSINGKEIFLKGMNWTPMDFLYDVSPERYEWCLTMAKNAGIQLLRIWNGGGMQESDTFYALCDKLGLMVWQDLFIANQHSTNAYPHVVLECQTAYNLYRTRNHPSLVLLCGGNEFNPYAYTNAANMFIMDRNVRTLTPDRIFHYTTSDKGSAHVYIDMEPVWYRTRYRDLPFMGESGIHSLPNFKSIKKLISEREASGILPDLADPSFAENYPDLLNHFTEYRPDRVPRMMARASQILDMRSITLAELCEATHVQSYEFYQLLIQSMQDHYPRCGGVMPWVFKRPWTTTAIQTVDGNDLPTFAYYAVQNAYRPLNVFWRQPWTVWAPGEEMTFSVGVFNQNGEDLSGALVSLTVYRPDLSACVSYRKVYEPSLAFDSLTLDEGYTDTCFLVCVDLMKEERVLARSVYFNKCTSVLADPELYRTYRSAPAENLRFENGPWLKPSVQQAKKARLSAQRVATGKTGVYEYVDVAVKNLSDVPAYPVTLDLTDEDKRFFLDENFFLLKPGEEKMIRLTCDSGTCGTVVVSAWNGERLEV
ncbi:MAG: hypothetical protein J6R89_05255, partial [Clostridia bacterium]|nr:hypothetical protein [Clostridia bacterium]